MSAPNLSGLSVVQIVNNSSSLTAGDTAVQNHLTSLGATVEPLSAGATTSSYTNAFSGASLFFVTAGYAESVIGTKLDAVGIPGCSLNGASFPNSKCSTSSGGSSGSPQTTLYVAQGSSDPITGPSTGATTIASSTPGSSYYYLSASSLGSGAVIEAYATSAEQRVTGYRYEVESILSDGVTKAQARLASMSMMDPTVLNSTGWAWIDNMTTWIMSGDKPPVANAGSNQSVAASATVTLNGSASSSPSGSTPLTYAWTQTSGSTVTLSSSTAVEPTFTAPSSVNASTLIFSLSVTDSQGVSSVSPASVTISVASNDTPPIASASAPSTATPGETVTLNGSGSSSPSGQTPLTYAWTQTAGTTVTLSSTTAVQPTFTAPSSTTATTLTFSLTVTDAEGQSSSSPSTVSIQVPQESYLYRLDTNGSVNRYVIRRM